MIVVIFLMASGIQPTRTLAVVVIAVVCECNVIERYFEQVLEVLVSFECEKVDGM